MRIQLVQDLINYTRKDLVKQLKQYLNEIRCKTSKIVFVYRKNTKNIGDLNCSPCLYFKEFSGYPSIDILDFKNINIKNKIIIAGGGGLFQKYFDESIKHFDKLSENNKVIYWGAGTDNTFNEELMSPDFLEKAALVGIRDKNTKYHFVPCVSCMSGIIDKYRVSTPPPKNKIAFYLHDHYSIAYPDYVKKYPVLYNHSKDSFEDIIKFLANTETIVTNSYHGAYWGSLLNKKIVIIPWDDKNGNVWFSNKFKQFPFKHIICDDLSKLEECINRSEPDETALEISRNKNVEFKNEVLKIISEYK